jgi:hypothetical protein
LEPFGSSQGDGIDMGGGGYVELVVV